MLIREARSEDTLILARLRWDFRTNGAAVDAGGYAEFEARFHQFFEDALAGGRWKVWVIEQDKVLIAQLYLQLIEKVPRPGHLDQQFGYITNVYMRPEYRNQGLGSRLIEHVIAWAKAQELEFIILWPSERSVPYYQREGFVYPHDAMELYLSDND